MAIDKDSNIWTQLKKIIKMIRSALSDVQDTTSPNINGITDEIQTAYNSNATDETDIDGLYNLRTSVNSSFNGFKLSYKNFFDSALFSLVVSENYPETIAGDTTLILEQIRSDMDGVGHSILQNTVANGSFSAGGSNIGNGTVLTTRENGEGLNLEYLKAETLTLKCTGDGQLGGTAGEEIFEIQGEQSFAPEENIIGGSGTGTINVSTADNVLLNGDFEDFATTNTPDNWDIDTGVVGTDIFEEGSGVAFGSKALKLANMSSGAQLSQTVNTVVNKNTKYLLSAMVDTDTVTAGTITVKVAGTGLSFSGSEIIEISSSYPASYTRKTATFNMPNNVPDDVEVQIIIDSSIDGDVFFDDVVLAPYTEHNGQFIAITRGLTDFVTEDIFTATNTNDRAGNINTFMGDFYSFQFTTSSAGANTVVDTL